MIGASVTALAVAGCAGESAGSQTAPTPHASRPTPATTTKAAPAAHVKCDKVPAVLTGDIMSGAQATAGTLTAVKAAAWRSPDFSELWFVAVRFRADGVPAQTGVWVTDSLSADDDAIMSVDHVAQQFTSWPAASGTAVAIQEDDRGVAAAVGCLA